MATRSRSNSTRRQVRTFALVWTGITIIMGACTFFGIFAAYGIVQSGDAFGTASSVALPLPTTEVPAVAAQPTATATEPPTALPVSPTSAPQLPTDAPTAAVMAEPTMEPTPLPVTDQTYQVGIQVQYSLDLNPDNQDGWMGEVGEKLGLNWYKEQVAWEQVEPEPGVYDWSKLDLALPSAQRFGIKVMVSVVAAPDWARETGVDTSRHGPPADNASFVSFVTTMLERYPGMIHAIEVWNEQNLDREWTSVNGLSASSYVSLLRDTYTAVKEVDPGVIVISGALSPTGGWTEADGTVTAIDDFVYMDQLISAGLLNYSDCVGVHHNGYNIGPNEPWDNVTADPSATFRGPFDNPHHSWSFYSTLNTYADKIQIAGGDQPLCITEFGWASTEDMVDENGVMQYPPGFEFATDNTLAEQAEWTAEAMSLMEDWGFVWLAFIWNLNYGPQAGWDPNNDNVPYSIIGKDWNFRPVYAEIQAWQQAYEARLGQ